MYSMVKFGATVPSAIPDLLNPQLLTFSSDRSMMVVGFEEIDGRRYYQGWRMQWLAAYVRALVRIECLTTTGLIYDHPSAAN
ncbi:MULTISPECIES: hypothetical protein [Achromobacter]|uniref:Uncharacterized protein n=1 Tax=Achromobacter spanius TaxID=217203 RepID=A0ABY8GVE0_9BURK|nr:MULTISPECIES: hypothetical protein [Achromobacter]WAI82283.1 hypothetical protein N8Z00_22525 [Achromobacter spanius]WEX92371.1 hypothetical protein N3Z32_17135 [Achromobacter sp. SS2-2022]WFP08479.1 hypothetical protein P8T11_01000 [Achromobacter spanius]